MNFFLWKKSRNPDLYIDLTNINGHPILFTDIDGTIDHLFREAIKSDFQKNNILSDKHREGGKVHFGYGNYSNAMHCFNFSLSGAENGTENIALAYANRSACFLHLGMPEESLVDIGFAKKAKYPEHLMHKLEARTMKCTRLLINEDFKENRFTPIKLRLSFDEHEQCAGVADCLKIHRNHEFGRHVITTRDLKIGETILLEQPFAIIRKRSYMTIRDRCIHCFKERMNFITCSNCVGGLFCDANCMEKSMHKYECNMPSALSRKETFELVLKMFFNINAAFYNVEQLIKTVEALLKGQETIGLTTEAQRNFCSLFQLNHNHSKQPESVLTRFRAATSVAIITIMRFPDFERKYVSMKHRRFLNHLILHLFHIAEHCVDLYEPIHADENEPLKQYEWENYACGMYAFGCFINHSCVPNISWYSVDGRLVCKVIRPIKKGEQIFRSYLPGSIAYAEDVHKFIQLDMRYHFQCKCFICVTEEWSSTADVLDLKNDPLYKEAIVLYTMNKKDIREWPREEIEYHEKKAAEFLEKYNRFHPVIDTIAIQEVLLFMWNILSSRN